MTPWIPVHEHRILSQNLTDITGIGPGCRAYSCWFKAAGFRAQGLGHFNSAPLIAFPENPIPLNYGIYLKSCLYNLRYIP